MDIKKLNINIKSIYGFLIITIFIMVFVIINYEKLGIKFGFEDKNLADLSGYQEKPCDRVKNPNSLRLINYSINGVKIAVEPGDNLWSVIKRSINNQDWYSSANWVKKAAITFRIVDYIGNLSKDDLGFIGIESGDPKLLHEGDVIDFTKIYGDTYLLSDFADIDYAEYANADYVSSGFMRDVNSLYSGDCRIPNSDLKTFSLLNPYVGKDKNAVYWGDTILDIVKDPLSFTTFDKVINGNIINGIATKGYVDSFIKEYVFNKFALDKDNVYFIFINNQVNSFVVDGADPKTFSFLFYQPGSEMIYMRDKESVYYFDNGNYNFRGKIDEADPDSLQIISYPSENNDKGVDYLRDLKSIYCHGYRTSKFWNGVDRLDNINPDNFKILNKLNPSYNYQICPFYIHYYATDGKSIYYSCGLIKDADLDTFEILPGEYSKDQYNYYFQDVKIDNIDKDSFYVLGAGFAKDKNHIYRGKDILKGTDYKTFEVLPYCFGAKDKHFTYDKENQHPNVNNY